MDPATKKKILFGVAVGAVGVAIFLALYYRKKPDSHDHKQVVANEDKFKPIERQKVIKILKKARKQNFGVVKKVAFAASKVAASMRMNEVDPEVVRNVVQGPQSHLKIKQSFQKNYLDASRQFSVTDQDFRESLDHYIKNGDSQIKILAQDINNDYETSLKGRLPDMKITVPANLTAQKLVQIQKRLTLKRYLVQIDIFKKIRGKNQKQLSSNRQLVQSLPNPQQQQTKILQQQGLGTNDQPAAAVFTTAVSKFKSDPSLKKRFETIQRHYAKIFGKYQGKIQQNKITNDELNELEDQLIYNQCNQ